MKKKFLITLSVVVCAILLVVGSIAGTIAYLTSTAEVTNTFTVGNVSITLDEAPVGEDGKATTGDRVTANQYHIIPDGEYDKDPRITLAANSDACYLFVKVENGLASVEENEDVDGANTIAAQLAANGWVALDDVTNVYVYTNAGNSVVAKSDDAQTFKVFETVIIDDDATNEALANLSPNTVKVTAYAVQSAGFDNAKAAWTGANFS